MRFFISLLVAMIALSMLGNAINIESHTNAESEDIIKDISKGVNKAGGRFNSMVQSGVDSVTKMFTPEEKSHGHKH